MGRNYTQRVGNFLSRTTGNPVIRPDEDNNRVLVGIDGWKFLIAGGYIYRHGDERLSPPATLAMLHRRDGHTKWAVILGRRLTHERNIPIGEYPVVIRLADLTDLLQRSE